MAKVNWATPFNSNNPILKLKKNGLQLNSPATRLLGEIKKVRVGVADNGDIVLKADNGPKSYTVTHNNDGKKGL